MLLLLLLLHSSLFHAIHAGAVAAAAPPLPSSVGLRQAVNVSYSAGLASAWDMHAEF
jgi:hypothetical protein